MSQKTGKIRFHFLTPCRLEQRKLLKAFIISIFKKERVEMESVDIIFCDDHYLLGLNQQFLEHDYYTDILSFPISAPGKPLIAEIYMSVDRIHENAKFNTATFTEELHRVVFHGILHFCGYKDKSAGDARKMRSMEDKYLKLYFAR